MNNPTLPTVAPNTTTLIPEIGPAGLKAHMVGLIIFGVIAIILIAIFVGALIYALCIGRPRHRRRMAELAKQNQQKEQQAKPFDATRALRLGSLPSRRTHIAVDITKQSLRSKRPRKEKRVMVHRDELKPCGSCGQRPLIYVNNSQLGEDEARFVQHTNIRELSPPSESDSDSHKIPSKWEYYNKTFMNTHTRDSGFYKT